MSNHSQDGYIAIAIVLILTVVVLGITVTVAQLGIGEGQVSLALSKGEDALYFAEGCMEDALLKVRADALYAGGTISRPEGTCTITIAQAGPNYTITATSTSNGYRRTIQTAITRSSSIIITSWKEQ